MFATLREGESVKLPKLEEMKDQFNLLKAFYTPIRCNMCTDFSVEYTDLAVGDPWLRGPDGRSVPGRSNNGTHTHKIC